MSGPIKVTFGALEQISGDITQVSSYMDNELQNLKSELNVLAQNYDGEAKEMWHQVQQKWDAAAAELQGTFAATGTAVNVAKENYVAAESKNKGLWG